MLALAFCLFQAAHFAREVDCSPGAWRVVVAVQVPQGIQASGIPLRLSADPARNGASFELAAATDADGIAVFSGLDAGEWLKLASHPWLLQVGACPAPGMGYLHLRPGRGWLIVLDLREWSFPRLDAQVLSSIAAVSLHRRRDSSTILAEWGKWSSPVVLEPGSGIS